MIDVRAFTVLFALVQALVQRSLDLSKHSTVTLAHSASQIVPNEEAPRDALFSSVEALTTNNCDRFQRVKKMARSSRPRTVTRAGPGDLWDALAKIEARWAHPLTVRDKRFIVYTSTVCRIARGPSGHITYRSLGSITVARSQL